MSDVISTEFTPKGPTAEQIRFAKRVIWNITGAPDHLENWYDTPDWWDGIKEYLRWAAKEAENRDEQTGAIQMTVQ